MLKSRSWFSTAALVFALALVPGCASNPGAPKVGTVSVRITGSAAGFDAVILSVREIALLGGADNGTEAGGEVLRAEPVQFDLLRDGEGAFVTLARTIVPAGHYTRLRLVLGDGSNVVLNGVTRALELSSASQGRLEIAGSFDVPRGGTQEIALSFDTEHSIEVTGQRGFPFHPVLRLYGDLLSGAIAGRVMPGTPPSTVIARSGRDTLGTTATLGVEGTFKLVPLPSRTYTVEIHPTGLYGDTTFFNVVVHFGQVTNVGEVKLSPGRSAVRF